MNDGIRQHIWALLQAVSLGICGGGIAAGFVLGDRIESSIGAAAILIAASIARSNR